MSNVAVVYHSSYGHTKALAEAVAHGAASVEGAKVC
jgi:NAD(P)H dehydrogenase (quinone)